MTDVKLLQSSKVPLPILVTEFGIVIDVKPLQPENADVPILVTEFGIVIDVKLLQLQKAILPILDTEFGIVIDAKPMQPLYLEVIDSQLFAVNTVERWIECYLWIYGK